MWKERRVVRTEKDIHQEAFTRVAKRFMGKGVRPKQVNYYIDWARTLFNQVILDVHTKTDFPTYQQPLEPVIDEKEIDKDAFLRVTYRFIGKDVEKKDIYYQRLIAKNLLEEVIAEVRYEKEFLTYDMPSKKEKEGAFNRAPTAIIDK